MPNGAHGPVTSPNAQSQAGSAHDTPRKPAPGTPYHHGT
jgi:hypothetical protein